MPERKLDKEDRSLIKLLWLEKLKVEKELQSLNSGSIGEKFDVTPAYIRMLWKEFENESNGSAI